MATDYPKPLQRYKKKPPKNQHYAKNTANLDSV